MCCFDWTEMENAGFVPRYIKTSNKNTSRAPLEQNTLSLRSRNSENRKRRAEEAALPTNPVSKKTRRQFAIQANLKNNNK